MQDSRIIQPNVIVVSESTFNTYYPYNAKVDAKYENSTYTIILPERTAFLDKNNVFFKGLLVHEIWHHFQNVYNIKYKCYNLYEYDAYVLQAAYLNSQGIKANFNKEAMEALRKC